MQEYKANVIEGESPCASTEESKLIEADKKAVSFSDDVVEIWWENPAPELVEAGADAADISKSLRIHFREKTLLFKRAIVQLVIDKRPKGDDDETSAVDRALRDRI
eukprot:scaffold2295_cov93-Skeletonema_dohrnii-CCMP3373.AAC.10